MSPDWGLGMQSPSWHIGKSMTDILHHEITTTGEVEEGSIPRQWLVPPGVLVLHLILLFTPIVLAHSYGCRIQDEGQRIKVAVLCSTGLKQSWTS